MTTYALTAGTLSTSQTLTISTADTVTFVERYNYVAVTNGGTGDLYVTTNGTAATGSGQANSVVVPPNTTMVIANQLPMWFQSSKVIPAGSAQLPRGGGAATVSPSSTVLTTPANPGLTQPFMASGQGQVANPGTTVSLFSAAADAYTVAGVG